MNRTDEFIAALRAAGLLVQAVVGDGRLRRVRAQGDGAGQRSGWYVLHPGPPMTGAYGNWKTGLREQWRGGADAALSAGELARLQDTVRHAQRRQVAERARRQAAARQLAVCRWQRAGQADPAYPYLASKGICAHGVRQLEGALLVPMRDGEGRLWSLQSIDRQGNKRFLAGGRKQGLYYAIGREVGEVVCVAEGFATAASVFEATGYPTAVAFDAGNLEPVARQLRAKFPHALIVLCADDDAATALRLGINPGLANAQRAAQAVGGVVAMPPRGAEPQ